MSNYETLERKLLRLLALELTRRLEDPEEAAEMPAATMAVIRSLTQDAGITLGDIQSGDFGVIAKDALDKIQEENNNLPFDAEDMPIRN